ncbi:hypothetical protein Lal_00012476 [Lupinus albus]|nr:hypothetical protein Lal_00012476 [Lupinus albus]
MNDSIPYEGEIFNYEENAYNFYCLLAKRCGFSYQSWKFRLSERFSLERERINWEDEILGYTGEFSPERELSRLGENWKFGVVDNVRFYLSKSVRSEILKMQDFLA